MRPWRKFYSSILESERFMDVSTEAKLLFCLLVVAQDDSGYYPWERMKVRRLVEVCGWTEGQATTFADELVDPGKLAYWEEGGIVIHNGEALNGHLRGDRHALYYPRPGAPLVNHRGADGLPGVTTGYPRREREEDTDKELAKEEEEKNTLPSGSSRKHKVDPVELTEDHITELLRVHENHWSEQDVREQIEEALAHTAAKKNPNQYLYVRGWLRRNAPKVPSLQRPQNSHEALQKGKVDSQAYIRRHGLPTGDRAQIDGRKSG